MSDTQWFIRLGTKEIGPLSNQELKDLVQQGSVTPETPISVDKSTWHEARTVKGLAFRQSPVAQSTVPPTQPAARPARGPLDTGYGESFGMEDADGLGVVEAVTGTVDQFKSLDYRFLLPVWKMFTPSLLRKKAVRWVLMFALLPLALWIAVDKFQLDFDDTVFLIQVYFCLFWALYFQSLIRPSWAVWRRGLGYAAFTCMVGIPLLFAAQRLPVIRNIYSGLHSESFFSQFCGYVFGVGPLEEICKALPLLILGLRGGKIRGIRDGLFLGLMSGFGFATAEGVMYTLRAAGGIIATQGSDAAFTGHILQTYFRLMTGPVLHGAWAGTVGWFIGAASTRTGGRWPIIVVGLAFAALLHGLYDVVANGYLGLVAAAVTILVFMTYLVHGEEQQAAATGVQSPAIET